MNEELILRLGRLKTALAGGFPNATLVRLSAETVQAMAESQLKHADVIVEDMKRLENMLEQMTALVRKL